MLITSKSFLKNIQYLIYFCSQQKTIYQMSNLIYQKKLRAYNDLFALLTSNVILTVEQETYLKEYLFILASNLHNNIDFSGSLLDFENWYTKQTFIELI
jgi:hypothetical protein